MIKYFLRKFVYTDTEYEPEVRDTLIRLHARRYVNYITTILMFLCLILLPFVSIDIIFALENIVIKPTTVYAVYGFAFLYGIVWTVIVNLFRDSFRWFFLHITEKTYYFTCTMHGKALSFKDFRIIKKYTKTLQNGYTLYDSISSQLSRGKCLLICLELLGLLKKGQIEFVAVRHLEKKEKTQNQETFDLHVIYLNNGWVYDTYTGRQYTEKKFFKVWRSIRYKQFSYDDFQGKSVYLFYAEKKKELQTWCKEHDCLFFIDN